MKTEINKRLKNHLLNIMKLEGDKEAWEYFMKLEPNSDELYEVIMFTPFGKEAWEETKQLQLSIEDLLPIVEHSEDERIKSEAETLLIRDYFLDNEALNSIVLNNHSDAAAKILLSQNPNNDQLNTIVRYSNLSDEAAREMLKTNQEVDELHEIIKHSSLKQEAWEKFIQLSPNTEEIIKVIQETDFDDTAWDYLLRQNPSNQELSGLIADYSSTGKKRKEAAGYILNNNPNVTDLIDFLQHELCAKDAWELMKKMTPSESELSSVIWVLIRLGCSLKNEVAEWCLKFNPSKKDLWYILEYSNCKDEAAIQLIDKPLKLHELADIVVQSTAEPVLEILCDQVRFKRESVNEKDLIQEIANKVLNDPTLLDVNHWHNGNSRSIGGWAIAMNEEAQRIEKEYGSEIAACLLLPNYKHLFFTDKETVLKELEKILQTYKDRCI